MKKIIRIIGKTIGGILACVFGILVLCCAVLLVFGISQTTRGEVTEELPVTPADFTPQIRIVTFTDTHNENENVADAVNTAYALFDNDPVYAGVDAFYGLGDFTSIGGEGDFANYVNVLQENVREDTVCINILGNHEMKNEDSPSLFTTYFGYEPDTVTEINGFTCIGFSGERWLTEWTVTPASLSWLSEQIEKAEETAGDKPIFVFQHPHSFGTVYGSTVWCNPQLNLILGGHSKIVSFSGHSHFPMNDPRSILQASYTAVGVGAMARFELDKNYIIGQHPDGYEDAAQFCVIEADDSGSVRIRGYDLLSDTFFCDYFIENVNDPDTYAYTYKNRKAHDSAPVFADTCVAQAVCNENGDYTVSFTQAQPADGYIVHNYDVKITDQDGKTVYEDTFINDYYITDGDNTARFTVASGVLQTGESYTLTVTAKSAYRLQSEAVDLPFSA